MGKGRILVVEDDIDISKMLRIYFDSQGYDVFVANTGREALNICHTRPLNVIILDIQLPDTDGYEIWRILRSKIRTTCIPIVILTQRDERSDKIDGLEFDWDDFITKPFDIEELKLRVGGAIRRSLRQGLTHPTTNLPAGVLIEEQLKRIKDSLEPWTLLYFGIRNVYAFKEVYGPIQVNEVLIFLADIMHETTKAHGRLDDFIGQASDNDFIIISIPKAASVICKTVTERFNQGCKAFYSSEDKKQGYIIYKDIDGVIQKADFMKIAVGAISSKNGPFADIVQITEDAAENRRQNTGCPTDEWSGEWFQAGSLSSMPIAERVIQTSQIILPSKIVKKADESWEAMLDQANQLDEHKYLQRYWPDLQKSLVEINRLTGGKIHDMSKIGVLLDLAAEDLKELPLEIANVLRNHQQLCRLAYENMNELRYNIHKYQEFKPALLGQTLANTINLIAEPRVQISSVMVPDSVVNIPDLKLQQVIYNLCRWFLFYHEEGNLDISIKVVDEVIQVIFTSIELQNKKFTLASLNLLNPAEHGMVYGYLAIKLATRYSGYITSHDKQIVLTWPLARQYNPSIISRLMLQTKIENDTSFLKLKEILPIPIQISEMARELIDATVQDLLARIEAMLGTLNTSIEINNKYPWSVIQRNLNFFHLLALNLRKDQPVILAPVNLKSLLENVESLLTHKIIGHVVKVESEVENPILKTDRLRLWQIFVNLALNALEAMSEDGTLEFRLKRENEVYVVEVIDNGQGIAPENLPKIFDLYFTTKGSGRGIGLYSVKQYVNELRGQIEVHSEVGQGTTFTVKLPTNWEDGYFFTK